MCFFGIYPIVEQERLRCACTNVQSQQSHHCLHTQSMDVGEVFLCEQSDQGLFCLFPWKNQSEVHLNTTFLGLNNTDGIRVTIEDA